MRVNPFASNPTCPGQGLNFGTGALQGLRPALGSELLLNPPSALVYPVGSRGKGAHRGALLEGEPATSWRWVALLVALLTAPLSGPLPIASWEPPCELGTKGPIHPGNRRGDWISCLFPDGLGDPGRAW